MATKIGDVTSIGKSENLSVVLDDRLTKLQLCEEPWNAIVDNGRHENGDSYTLTAVFTVADFATLIGYRGVLVPVTFDDGTILTECRVLVRSYKPTKDFETLYKDVSLEIWRL